MDCGLAGTVLRFVPPVAALSRSVVGFDGDEQARARPIAPLLDALRTLGVGVDGDAMPFSVTGTGSVRGGRVEIDASSSSQFVSGLMLSGAGVHRRADDRAHRDVGAVGAAHRDDGGDAAAGRGRGGRRGAEPLAVSPGTVAARHWEVEPDLSNAVPFLAAAVVSGGTVRVAGWPRPACSPPTPSWTSGSWRVSRPRRIRISKSGRRGYGGFDVDLHDVGELAPAVAALAALAAPGSVSRLRGIAHLRGHETDRLAALSAEINGLGGDCGETDDGLVITATAAARRACGGPTPTTGWRRPARSSGCGCPGSRWTTSPPPRRRCPDFPRLWADMLAGQGWAARQWRRRDYDESDVRIRPGRGSRPRTKTRPEHADAEAAMVVTVDRGRWGCVLGGDPRPTR